MCSKLIHLLMSLLCFAGPALFAQAQTIPTPIETKANEVVRSSLNGEIDGGEETFGCLGCATSLKGTILKIFPESDLNRVGVVPKDRIIKIEGQKYHPFKFVKQCVGAPGTLIDLTIIHEGQVEDVSVQRIDARSLSQHAHYYRNLAKQNKYW